MNELGHSKFTSELLETHECSKTHELRKKEGEYIKMLKPELNKPLNGRTPKELYNDEKEKCFNKNE